MEPLAYKLRPTRFEDIVGQEHLIGKNGVITRMLKNRSLPSIILYGSPGIGKTTIALAICHELKREYYSFNASIDNKATLKEIIDKAQGDQSLIVIIDEIHRMKKDIQDYLLPFVERGTITIIGLTTINPYHSINPAVRSRCTILRLNPLSEQNLETIFHRSFSYLDKEITIEEEAKKYIISLANGDVRSLINMIECVYFTLNDEKTLTLAAVKEILLTASVSIDKNEDSFYDTLSGLHKSIRGSDVNASLHYLAKLITSEDFLPLIRRLYCIFYEDISLANPNLGPRVKAACEVALELGMPEAVLPLSSIVVEMALSPKSNSTYLAIHAAMKDIEEGRSGSLPLHLKNTFSFDPNQGSYKYPHDYPGAWVDQQYLPDKIKNAKYWTAKPTSPYEETLKERYEAIEKAKKNK
ncbi:MAG TPA: replication-associated recombination protein A [Bacilli bacterium]|jgi:putative ATPase|nr:replication-associated recombination protein A [Acholeplasmataceae bacterium]HNZ78234.1 replication-associated recombination protein A [Bacilli bacterium]HOD60763.1 replication-associated recombination protein A [Bacilli bacterium]HOH61705.1 replication-associated recombination protein A [Bacilli bacterium]HPB49215.1 replication-associated recombination protein A [Bacilli bacterium]